MGKVLGEWITPLQRLLLHDLLDRERKDLPPLTKSDFFPRSLQASLSRGFIYSTDPYGQIYLTYHGREIAQRLRVKRGP